MRIDEIVALQHRNGGWGHFHTLFGSQKCQLDHITTEQALWRLFILGATAEDKPIQQAIKYMEAALALPVSPVFFEKTHDPKIFSDRMLATWLRLFVPEHPSALRVGRQWAGIIEEAFADGTYDHMRYTHSYEEQFGKQLNPKAGALVDFVHFYPAVLLQGLLLRETENAYLDYALTSPKGMFYIYKYPLNVLPEEFATRRASQYVAALEVLAGFALAPEKLAFAVQWLRENQDENRQWDFGSRAKDGVYFPLTDSWSIDRKQDCTMRVERLLTRLQ